MYSHYNYGIITIVMLQLLTVAAPQSSCQLRWEFDFIVNHFHEWNNMVSLLHSLKEKSLKTLISREKQGRLNNVSTMNHY